MKLIVAGVSSLLGLSLAGFYQDPPRPKDDRPPPKAKGKKGAPGDELRKTYELLRRVRSDGDTGRVEERINDWTERATRLYRRALQTREQGDPRRAREIGTAAHDLARAIDHARNAARLDRPDPDLPPPDGVGPEDASERTRRDLGRAYERITSFGEHAANPSKFYLDAARDLYNAARRDIQAGRDERGGELARAAEAMTHVPEHLSRAEDGPGGPGSRIELAPAPPEAKKKDRPHPRGVFDPPPDRKGGPDAPRDRELPPPLS